MAPIFVLTGPPGSCKSTICQALMKRFPKGIHLPVDDFHRFVVSGRADPVPEWTEETGRQFELARLSMADTAKHYHDAGFAIAVDDVIFPAEVDRIFKEKIGPDQVHGILLRPSLTVTLERNADRTHKSFDTSILDQTIRQLYDSMGKQKYAESHWLVLNTNHLTVEQTVETIITWANRTSM